MGSSLAGQVALVTGASSGIGRATALKLAEQGAHVALNYYSLEDDAKQIAHEIAERYHRETLLFPVDIAKQADVEAMVDAIQSKWGRLDLLVSSAVFSEREPFLTADVAAMQRTLDVSLWGAFYALRACCNKMVANGRGGAVVIVSSPHAQIAFPNCMAYNMAKAALDMMAKTAATELLPQRIRVNAIYPGWTDTPGERKFMDDDSIRKAAANLPWGRLATAEEVAGAITWLCGPDANYMTGSILHLDGGLFLPWWSNRGSGQL